MDVGKTLGVRDSCPNGMDLQLAWFRKDYSMMLPLQWTFRFMRRFCCATMPLFWMMLWSTALWGQVSDENNRAALYAELAQDTAALRAQSGLLKKMIRVVRPTVVHLDAKKTEGRNTGFGTHSVDEAGSGVIVEINGGKYVITNRHVIRDARLSNIIMRLDDGRQVMPKRIWMDAATDVAVIEVKSENLVPARLGDSQGLEIGDFVVAMGSPFGLSHSVTFGIVSAKGRRDLKLSDDETLQLQNFIQTDAAINPGNSGGPLMNLRGEVVGINTAIASNSGGNEGIGFSIPVNMVMFVARQLIESGTVVRAYLGVHLDSSFGPAKAFDLGLKRPGGTLVTGVTPGSPAQDANLQRGDVVLKFNEHSVEDLAHLVNLVSMTPLDQNVKLVVFRDGKSLEISVKLAQRNRFEPNS